MLSIGAMGGGQGTYYVGLAAEDYYLAGGEPPGRWLGRGAEGLGLAGQVERESFLRLFAGFDAEGSPLVQNAGSARRQPGWDLTFSAPKSVSATWAVANPQTRHAIQEAHFRALDGALKYLEEGATTRRGHGGAEKEPARLIVATFEHGTSRAQDPQLHTHCLVLNLGLRADGTTGALESQGFYRSKMAAGALYRAELSRELEGLGFAIVREGKTFEIAGVPSALQVEFSKRRMEIEARLDQSGHGSGQGSARAAAFAALDTRQVKEHRAREELFGEWREAGARHGFTPEQVQEARLAELRRGDIEKREPQAELADALKNAIEKISRDKSHFSERDLVRAVAEEAPGRGLSAAQITAGAQAALAQAEGKQSQNLVALGEWKGEARYSTRELVQIERALIATAEQMAGDTRHQVEHRSYLLGMLRAEEQADQRAKGQGSVNGSPVSGPQMSEEQRRGLAHLTKASGRVAVLSGMAGTGKTFLLEAAREAWEAQGFTVRGAAVAGKAARGLEEGAGISSQTLARLLRPENAAQLDAKTVLVVDEAGMVGTRQMAQLLGVAARSGTKIVLVGDSRQLQAVEVGGPLQALEKRLGRAELSGIVRQREEWQRNAVKNFAEGRAMLALRAFQERGRLHVAEDSEGAKAALIRSWHQGGLKAPGDNLILAGTREEAHSLNRLAQEERRHAGLLGFRSVRLGRDTIHEKDRVIFTKNSQSLGVQNGTMGTVQEIDLRSARLSVKLDGGDVISVPYRAYEDVALGYALTTHKAQGATVKNAFVLCGGPMADRETAYVQASRAREGTDFFAGKIMVWNPEREMREEATLPELARQMSQSRQKDLAHTVLWGQSPRQEDAPQQRDTAHDQTPEQRQTL